MGKTEKEGGGEEKIVTHELGITEKVIIGLHDHEFDKQVWLFEHEDI